MHNDMKIQILKKMYFCSMRKMCSLSKMMNVQNNRRWCKKGSQHGNLLEIFFLKGFLHQ